MADVIEHLRAVPLFGGMTDRAIAAVAALATERGFADGEVVVREGEPGDAFYVVVDGSLEVTQQGASIVTLGAGDFLGEISLIDGRSRTATVAAVGPVKTLVIERPAFLTLMDSFAGARLGILMALTDRIRRDTREASQSVL